ncbi:divergent polysaccharide deacetylase family protein [Ghiorsea bivora]|uniref:divergent polysaccharide deacetylase family protein n=1 Tax=Ghiorsea bivora TaxID=1485545 RepID=UPI00068A1168|nr:divergent polysaccharide deacetylase family protein [Ghiorsea bivora]
MKKKTKKKKQQQAFWFKILLTILLILIVLLVWVASEKKVASNISQILVSESPSHTEPDIAQVIAPLLDDTYVLTFEDELPDPVFKSSTKQVSVHPAENRHVLSLIIDDVGYDLHALERLIALPYTITVSILPDSPHAKEAAMMAHQHGIQVMLHMPMQTANPKYQQKMEKFYLHQDMDKQSFTTVFEQALAKVPYVEGVNNHMGSLLTSNPKSMQWLMELCKKHGLFFIDSRTSSSSVAAEVAQQSGILWNTRDVFLDHAVTPVSLQHAWNSMLSCVKRKDSCIMLAHPHQETLNFLKKHAQGISLQAFVSISEALKQD